MLIFHSYVCLPVYQRIMISKGWYNDITSNDWNLRGIVMGFSGAEFPQFLLRNVFFSSWISQKIYMFSSQNTRVLAQSFFPGWTATSPFNRLFSSKFRKSPGVLQFFAGSPRCSQALPGYPLEPPVFPPGFPPQLPRHVMSRSVVSHERQITSALADRAKSACHGVQMPVTIFLRSDPKIRGWRSGGEANLECPERSISRFFGRYLLENYSESYVVIMMAIMMMIIVKKIVRW